MSDKEKFCRSLEWYIAIPKTTRPFCEAIERYIGVFR
jgi:hypothetical protein